MNNLSPAKPQKEWRLIILPDMYLHPNSLGGLDVLDIACGVGYGSKLLKEAGARSVVGVDISEEAIKFARANYSSDDVVFIQADAVKYASDRRYDAIISFETIEHVPDSLAVLKNFSILLKKGGLLIISSPNKPVTSPNSNKPGNPFHFKEFTIAELTAELIKCGFQLPGDYLFGQRLRRYFKNRYLRRIHKMIFKPDLKSSADVSRVKIGSSKFPRYFVIKAIMSRAF